MYESLDDLSNTPLYPLNKSLAEEVERLFSEWSFSLAASNYRGFEDDVMTEFRLNGKDSEYCPELISANRSCVSSTIKESRKSNLNSGYLQTVMPLRSKKRAKKQTQECVFCKNNGEDVTYYQQHVLKDPNGRIVCPILRAYTCPICCAKGDEAHTIKYCPKNINPELIPALTTLKARRTSTGQKRTTSL